MMMRHVDLCSGIGGFALGFEWAGLSTPILFCDIEKWSRKILAKHWPNVPIAEDVKELANDPDGLIPDCDILTAGYPCQPFSFAGERRGREDDRHIWPYILSIVKAKRPTWCVYENVYGHVSMGLCEVLFDLEREGYAARPFIVPACAVDAPHRRDRVWIIARNVGDTDSKQRRATKKDRRVDLDRAVLDQRQGREKADTSEGSSGNVADTCSVRQQGRGEKQVQGITNKSWQSFRGSQNPSRRWPVEPRVGRVVNGIPRRVDRLRGLGNAIVPQIAMRIGMCIIEAEKEKTRAYQSNGSSTDNK